MKTKLIALLQDAIAIIEAADLEDTEHWLNQSRAVLKAIEARKAVSQVFAAAEPNSASEEAREGEARHPGFKAQTPHKRPFYAARDGLAAEFTVNSCQRDALADRWRVAFIHTPSNEACNMLEQDFGAIDWIAPISPDDIPGPPIDLSPSCHVGPTLAALNLSSPEPATVLHWTFQLWIVAALSMILLLCLSYLAWVILTLRGGPPNALT